MAIMDGKDGAVYISNSSIRGNLTGSSSAGAADPGTRGFMHEILKLTSWSLSQPGSALLDATNFGDEWVKHLPGIRDGGTINISGLFDWADTTGQQFLSSKWNQGDIINYPAASSSGITNVSSHSGYRFELWPDNSTATAGAKVGMWRFSTAADGTTAFGSRKLIIESLNVAQDRSGLGTVDMTLKISGGFFAFTTDLKSTN